MYKKTKSYTYPSFQANSSANDFLIRPLRSDINRIEIGEKPHRHDWQEIIFVRNGQGKQKIDNEIIELQRNCFYLISKGQVHDFLEGRALDGFLIRFNENILPSTPKNILSSNVSLLFSNLWCVNSIPIESIQAEQYLRILNTIEYEYKHANKLNTITEVLRHMFLSFVIKLMSEVQSQIEISQPNYDNDRDIVMSFLILVNDYFSSQHELMFYLTRLNMDNRKLRRLTLKHTGLTPKKIIVNRLMDEAKRMLQYSNMNFKEISLQLGYSDSSYFSKHFKLQYQVSPKQYRNSFR